MIFSTLLFCVAVCSQPLEPSAVRPAAIQASSGVATDSACRTLTITLVGSNNVDVAFPDRTQCGSGLVLVPAGAPSRGGPAKRNVSVPIRVLNASGYAFQSPASVVLAPDARVVVDPAGQAASKVIPQNTDSVRAGRGAWVWRVGAGGTVAVGDSTAAKTLVIRLDSPVTSGRVRFVMEAVQYTPQGWTVITHTYPAPDTTKLLTRPGTEIVYYRTDATIRFNEGASSQVKQSFFAQTGISVLGVRPSPETFYVRIPDPGMSIEAFDVYYSQLSAMPEVLSALPATKVLVRRGVNGRFPDDGAGHRRSDWLRGSHETWSRRDIRL